MTDDELRDMQARMAKVAAALIRWEHKPDARRDDPEIREALKLLRELQERYPHLSVETQ